MMEFTYCQFSIFFVWKLSVLSKTKLCFWSVLTRIPLSENSPNSSLNLYPCSTVKKISIFSFSNKEDRSWYLDSLLPFSGQKSKQICMDHGNIIKERLIVKWKYFVLCCLTPIYENARKRFHYKITRLVLN